MIPALATRGKLVLAAGTAFVVVGGIHAAPPLVALGTMAISALLSCYLWFFPTAILLRRRKIELSWWIPPGDQPGGALAVERPFPLHVALRNHGQRSLRVLDRAIHATAGLEPPRGLEARVPRGCQVELRGEAVARAAGYSVLHGALIAFGDALGLFDVRAYFPNPIAVKVFPRQAGLRGGSAVVRPRGGALHERAGVHQVRRRGMSGELRELREHTYGDPFKFVAWKATARRGKLMVRDLETEVVVTHALLLDIGGTMRLGSPGRSRLDRAVETAAGLARATLDGGDWVGLVSFDTRVYAELKPDEGYHHFLKLIDRLLEVHNVVDEDLTDLTSSELVAAVAGYLAHQEAVDVRLRRAPELDDTAWNTIHAGPRGELYDVGAMGAVVATLLEAYGQTAGRSQAPAWWWSRVQVGARVDPLFAKLRLFCRLRGLELPYRATPERGARAQGLAAALKAAQSARADVAVILSDLGGLDDRPEPALQQLGLARRSGLHVIVVVPATFAASAAPVTPLGARLAAAVAGSEAERLRVARELLARHGVPVVELGPKEGPAALARRIARAHASMRRVA